MKIGYDKVEIMGIIYNKFLRSNSSLYNFLKFQVAYDLLSFFFNF